MPHRVTHVLGLVLGVLGLVLLGVILLTGADVHRAARTGPRWKRAMVAAGLVLLAALGFGPGTARAADTTPAAQPAAGAAGATTQPAAQLADTDEWKRLTGAWKEAEEVASGKRGDYPFDEKGKKALLESLTKAGREIDALAEKRMLSETEVRLLKIDVERLRRGVQGKRPTEMRMATCYRPISLGSRKRIVLARLTERLELLEKVGKAGKLHPAAVAKVVESVEGDIASLSGADNQKQMIAEDVEKAGKAIHAAGEHLQQIKARLAGYSKPLAKTQEWGIVMAYWRHAAPLAESGKSTTAERKQVDGNLKTATAALDELVKDGLLTKAETGLLRSEMNRIREQVYRDPPTDSMVECYKMMFLPPAQKSLVRLEDRLGLLKSVAASGKVQLAAIRKVLPSIRADLKTLADPAKLKEVREPERQRAAKLAAEARQALQKIEAILSESK